MITRVAPALLLLLAACSPSAATPESERADGPVDAVRVAMPADEAAATTARPAGVEGAWVSSPDAALARFGYPGEPALLSLECRAGTLVVTRNVAAPVGAEALFALQGSGLILRLPVDATAMPGQRGYVWQGTIAADDHRLAILEGKFNGTLPGGGHIEVLASDVPRAVIQRCEGAG
ncbi:MAG: hypothetical protein ACKVOL_16355 [Novosphingobium sp.]